MKILVAGCVLSLAVLSACSSLAPGHSAAGSSAVDTSMVATRPATMPADTGLNGTTGMQPDGTAAAGSPGTMGPWGNPGAGGQPHAGSGR